MNNLASFLKEWVMPTLTEAGFRQRGLLYRLEPATGGLAVVQVRRFPLTDALVTFYVDIAVSPAVLVDFELRDLPTADRHVGNLHWADWVSRLRPRQRTLDQSRPLISRWDRMWEIDPPWVFPTVGDASVCGQDLQDQLVSTVPSLLRLTEVDGLLAAVRSGPPPLALQLHRDWAEAVLLSTAGDSAELRKLLNRIDAQQPDNPVTSWIRERTSRNAVLAANVRSQAAMARTLPSRIAESARPRPTPENHPHFGRSAHRPRHDRTPTAALGAAIASICEQSLRKEVAGFVFGLEPVARQSAARSRYRRRLNLRWWGNRHIASSGTLPLIA